MGPFDLTSFSVPGADPCAGRQGGGVGGPIHCRGSGFSPSAALVLVGQLRLGHGCLEGSGLEFLPALLVPAPVCDRPGLRDSLQVQVDSIGAEPRGRRLKEMGNAGGLGRLCSPALRRGGGSFSP